MEINITEFFNSLVCPQWYSASILEIGQNAAAITWEHAKNDSEHFNLLQTEEMREAFKNRIRGFGAWDDEDIAAWDNTELNALFIQLISGDVRECSLSNSPPDWEAYEQEKDGRCSGNIFKGVDGNVYYYLSN